MIDFETIRNTVTDGLQAYLDAPVIRANQNEAPPAYPYVSYTVTTLQSENNGTWQVHDDGTDRQAVTQTWSITAQSNENAESITLASKAREWLQHTGKTVLNDNGVIVQKCTSITNRDNLLTVEYEYKNGFDVVFWLYDEAENPVEETGYIDNFEINDNPIDAVTVEELNTELERRLDGIN